MGGDAFDVLLRRFGVKMECFASPFNCRYSRFCSAFRDTDGPFGRQAPYLTVPYSGTPGNAPRCRKMANGCTHHQQEPPSVFFLSGCPLPG